MSEETDKMKDLLIKLQILTNGLVEERKKSKNYLEKIKELEKMLEKKDNEVVDLTKKNFDLQANLTFEKSKQSTKSSKKLDENHYEAIINEQGYKLRELTEQLKNEKEIFKQQKAQFQELISKQIKTIAELKEKYENTSQRNKELETKIEEVKQMNYELQSKDEQNDKKFQKYKNDIGIIQTKNIEFHNQIEELKLEKYDKEKEIEQLKKKNEDLSLQLMQMKTLVVNKKLTTKSFKVEMVKPKKIIEIVFQKNKERENGYEIVIKGKNKKDSEERINLLDISQFQINEKDKTIVNIEYMVRKKYLLLFIV